MSSLFVRERTGRGAELEVSLIDALAEWMGYPAYYTGYGGTAPMRSRARHAAIAPYGPFTTSDGHTLLLAIQNDREWEAFCAIVLEMPELATDEAFRTNADRVEHREPLERHIDRCLKTVTAEKAKKRLERGRIAYAAMRTIEEFLAHPQLAARRRWAEMDSPVGRLWVLRPPVETSGVNPEFGPIPAIGQHSEAILEELGYDGSQIAELREKGIV